MLDRITDEGMFSVWSHTVTVAGAEPGPEVWIVLHMIHIIHSAVVEALNVFTSTNSFVCIVWSSFSKLECVKYPGRGVLWLCI